MRLFVLDVELLPDTGLHSGDAHLLNASDDPASRGWTLYCVSDDGSRVAVSLPQFLQYFWFPAPIEIVGQLARQEDTTKACQQFVNVRVPCAVCGAVPPEPLRGLVNERVWVQWSHRTLTSVWQPMTRQAMESLLVLLWSSVPQFSITGPTNWMAHRSSR